MTPPPRKLLLGSALLTVAVCQAFGAETAPASAPTHTDGSTAPITLAIPAQRLADALRQLAEASGLQLVYDAKIVEGKSSPGATGTMSNAAALAALLAGSGLRYQFSGDRTVIVSAGGEAARLIGVVNVNGVGGPMPFRGAMSPVNGINGSRDVEATESTGSYTTGATSIVSKIPLPIRDIAQSVSVMTLQQIQDQNLISVKDILDKIAGVSISAGSTTEDFDIYSRGFTVTSFAFDGGAPTSTAQSGYRPLLNMSEFDSVQLIRGADGLFGGYADPGGVVNLVRKKPLDHNQFTYEQDIGSWNNFREVVDLTGPLTADRTLRARVVVSDQDNKFFYRVAQAHKKALYGVLEYDLAPKTLLTLGASYNQERNTPNNNGLPRYANGEAIDWSTSTCFCLPSAHDRARKSELFASLSHEFSSNLSARLNLTSADTHYDGTYYGIQANLVKDVSSSATFSGFNSKTPQKQTALEFVTNGSLSVFGREQTLVVGGNLQKTDTSGATTTYVDDVAVADVFHFDPSAYSTPAYSFAPYGEPDYIVRKNISTQYGLYANLRVAPIDDLHVTFGMRYSTLKQSLIQGYKPSYTDLPDEVFPNLRDRSHSKPNVGLTYDFLGNFTAYGSYQATYQPQNYARYVKAPFIPPPITGVNEELGLKWQSTDKALNGSVSLYRITQNGFLSQDYSTVGADGYATAFDEYSIRNYKSQGADVELAGELFSGLQASLSYAYNINSQETTYASAPAPKSSFTPRHIAKSWLTYRGTDGGPIGRFIVGGGIELKSQGYTDGYVCSATTTGGGCGEYSPYAFTTPGYAIVSAKVGYVFNPHLEASLKLDNLTNTRRYLATQYQSASSYNFYVTPFNLMASLKATF